MKPYSYGELIVLQQDMDRLRKLRTCTDTITRQYDVIGQLIDDVFNRLDQEDDETISEWANETFGEVKNNISIATRANKEMAELLHLLAICDTDPKAAEEAADVVIVLCRLFTRLKTRLQAQVDAKMKINRGREWSVDGSGHGQHIAKVSEAPPVLTKEQILAMADESAALGREFDRRTRGMETK